MRLTELRSAEADFRDGMAPIAVLPLGAVEQHSGHLPLGTDAIIVDTVARRLERKLPNQVLLLPTISVGASDHHLTMSGSVSVGTSSIADAAARQCISLARSSGITQFLLLNGHGGNQPAVRLALELIHTADPSLQGFAADYWALMFDRLDAEGIERPATMGHADHIETSILRALRPELVDMSCAAEDRYDDDLPGFVFTTAGIPDRTHGGGVGDPRHATAEHGARFLDLAVEASVALVERICGMT
ncbi:creatininase family protein [Agromyces sp. NPDC058064]|uniref:creatininase family protein n=1 Tax=Agromyces sp. NPDC058064 TaxID=3346322 RepID=UPI0036DB93AF